MNSCSYHLNGARLAVQHGGAALTSQLCLEDEDVLIEKYEALSKTVVT